MYDDWWKRARSPAARVVQRMSADQPEAVERNHPAGQRHGVGAHLTAGQAL